MSKAAQKQLPTESAPRPKLVTKGDSVPIGTIWLSGMVQTTNGYCVAQFEVPAELWESLPGKKSLGLSQTFPEHIARQHKQMVMALGQRVQSQRSRFK